MQWTFTIIERTPITLRVTGFCMQKMLLKKEFTLEARALDN